MDVDQNLKHELERSSRVWLRNAFTEIDLSYFDEAATDQSRAGQRLRQTAALISALGHKSSLRKAIQRLDPNAKPVRVIAFNKSEKANWGVSWHQDRAIAVAQRAEVAGFCNWTRKSGVWHCEPPQEILDRMLFVRVHLDDTDISNGAMEIAIGSHSKGIIPLSRATSEAVKHPIEVCEAKRGDVLVLKMLTLHSSKPAYIRTGRRVLRIDFATSELPEPLAWTKPDSEIGPI